MIKYTIEYILKYIIKYLMSDKIKIKIKIEKIDNVLYNIKNKLFLKPLIWQYLDLLLLSFKFN